MTAGVPARNADIAQAFMGGATVDALCTKHSLSRQSVCLILRKAGIAVRAVKKARGDKNLGCFPWTPSERNTRMVVMYQQGLTLEKIGQHFGLTRERVRQVVSRQGVTSADGGTQLKKRLREERESQNNDARYQLKYGFPKAVVKQYQLSGMTRAFNAHQVNARRRAIPFLLSFREWITIWEASGKLHLRGKGVGKYVMSRIKDDGCYEVGNVHIQLATDNSREAVEQWRGKTKAHRGVYLIYPGRPKAWRASVGGKSIGFFHSKEEAVAARAAVMAERGIQDSGGLGNGLGYMRTKAGTYHMQGGGRSSTHKTPEEARAAYLKAIDDLKAERALSRV